MSPLAEFRMLNDKIEELRKENDRLHRVIGKELSENDELGREYTYVNALRQDKNEAYEKLDAIQAKLKLAVEALEYIGNSIPGPDQTFELENKRAAQNALKLIKGDGE